MPLGTRNREETLGGAGEGWCTKGQPVSKGKESASSPGTLLGLELGMFTEAPFHLGVCPLLGPGQAGVCLKLKSK